MKKIITMLFILLSFSAYSSNIDELIKKADGGDAQAQYDLGSIYSDKNSTTKDYDKSI